MTGQTFSPLFHASFFEGVNIYNIEVKERIVLIHISEVETTSIRFALTSIRFALKHISFLDALVFQVIHTTINRYYKKLAFQNANVCINIRFFFIQVFVQLEQSALTFIPTMNYAIIASV